MTEYWEITHERGLATDAVWQMDNAFVLRNLTRTQHKTNVDSLPTLAQGRANAELALASARSGRDDTFALLDELNVRATGVIAGLIDDEDDLHGQLDLVFAVTPSGGNESVLRRSRLLLGVWGVWDAQQTAAAKPLLSLEYKAGPNAPVQIITLAAYTTATVNGAANLQTVANGERGVSNAKSALRSTERRVDRDNKRWYAAWVKQFPAGTAKGDAAFSQVPTEQGASPANPLQIASAVPTSDHHIIVNYEETGGEHALTLELLTQLPGEPDFGHAVTVLRPQQTIGPFVAGTIVRLRTRAANSLPGYVLGGMVQLLA